MNFPQIQKLLNLLASAENHSAEDLANEMSCRVSDVHELVRESRQLGWNVKDAVDNGFSLTESLELLDRARILSSINANAQALLSDMQIESTLDSTNAALRRQGVDKQHACVILAEHQSSGRGRRGREWVSPFARNLYLSLGWRFDKSPAELSCLPLVVALATANALSRAGLQGHCIKWPNDLLLDGKKLCGCLVDTQSEPNGPFHAILGVGINVHMPASELTASIDQAWTDLSRHLPDVSRNILAAMLLEELLDHLTVFATDGFEPFRQSWQKLDGLFGQSISAVLAGGVVSGTAAGIDKNGALLLDIGKETLTLHSGEVSLRKTRL